MVEQVGLALLVVKIFNIKMSFISKKILNSNTENLTWNTSNVPLGGNWSSVTFGNGKFVAVSAGGNGTMAYSEDNAITWNVIKLQNNIQWTSVIYGNGKFVAVSFQGYSAYSLDAITWNVVNLPQNATSVTFGNNRFVAVSSFGLRNPIYSNNGITWALGTLQNYESYNLTSVTYGNGKFVAVSSLTNWSTIYSTDGITWVEPQLLYYDTWTSVTYGNGKFVAVEKSTVTGGNTTRAMYSTDGITWTFTSIPGGNGTYTSVIYGGNKFVAVGSKLRINSTSLDNVFAYSTDGVTWFNVTVPSEWKWGFNSVTYGNGRFVAISSSSFHAYSTDGINWTRFNLLGEFSLSSVYGDNKFVGILRQYSNHVLYSNDGINWDLIQPLRISRWYSIAYGAGKFVAISIDNYISYSTDGINWTETTPPFVLNNNLRGIVYGNGVFVLVGDSKWYYSTDGITWNINNSFSNPNYSKTPIYGNNTFIRLPNLNGIGYSSTDGITWNSFSSQRWCESAVYVDGKFVCKNSSIPTGSINDVTSFISNTNDFINFEDTFIFQPPTESWSNIEYGNGLFVIFYYVNFLLSSKSSRSWRKGKLPVNGAVATLSFGDNKFLASYDDGTVKYSIV